MLPPNALPRIRELLIDDFLTHESCRHAAVGLGSFYEAYNAQAEIEIMARDCEEQVSTLLAECVELAKTSAPRSSIFELIKGRMNIGDITACKILAAALHRWSTGCDEGAA